MVFTGGFDGPSTVNMYGIFFGVVSSFFVAANAIYTKKVPRPSLYLLVNYPSESEYISIRFLFLPHTCIVQWLEFMHSDEHIE